MAELPLDLTGSLVGNKVTGETRSITRDIDRYFVPVNGAIFDHNGSFKIYNALSGARLQPNTQYRLLHLVDSAVKITNKNVYAVIHIVDKTLTTVRYDYQAVGGVYQNIASTIDARLSEYLYDTTGSNTIGAVVGVPVQVPPEHHLQNINDFQGTGALVGVLENIRTALILGNAPAFASAYEFIDYRYQQATNAIRTQFDEAVRRLSVLEEKTQIKNGDYIITANPANPSTYLGYGNWVLDSNTLLMGSVGGTDVGEYVDIGAGTGHVAVKRYFWRRDDSATGATYSISSSSTVVNEGQTVTITLHTTGVTEGTKIAYRITGITENDLVNGKLTDYFTINAAGVATLVLSIRQDMETEGAEVMRVSLTAMPTKFVDVTINDTSKAAVYTMRFSGSANGSGEISSVNEGAKAYLVVNTEGVAVGTRIYLLYNDSTTSLADSATNDWPLYFDVVASGMSIIEYSIKADQLTEGAEALVVNLCSTNNINSRVARAVLTVNDTSRSPSAVVQFSSNTAGTASITQANEGTTVYAFLSTTNINNGEFLDIAYSGTVTQADFTNTLPTRVTVQNNQAMVTLNIAADVKTEGDELFVVRALYNGVQLHEGTLIIKDTSVNPSYNLKFSTNSSGTDAVTRANEGQSIYLYLQTTNVPDGTILNVTYSGTIDPTNDLSNYPRTLTVIGNQASGVVIIKADQLTEGEETLIVEVKNGVTSIGTAMLYINDTSASPTAVIRFSNVAGGGNTITQTNEGTTVFAILETTNIANGTVITVSHTGSATADDFVNTRANTVTVNNNMASLELQVKNDLLTEGQETYRLTATLPNGDTVTSDELKIIDTSVPTLNVYFSGNSTGSGQISSVNEGQTVYLVIETNGIATGVNVAASYSGSTVASDVSSNNYGTTNIPITGSRTIVPYTFADDMREDGAKTMTVTITVPGITDSKSATVSIADTSRYKMLTGAGNIVVPPGQVARIIVMGGGGYADMKSDGMPTVGYLGLTTLTIDGKDYRISSGNTGGQVIGDGSSFLMDGVSGAVSLYPRDFDLPADYHIETPVDRDGIVQMLSYSGLPGLDQGYVRPLNLSNLSAAISQLIDSLAVPTPAPQVTINGKTATPGYGAGANALVILYKNAGTTARTIPVAYKPPFQPVSGIAGQPQRTFVEFFDSVQEASVGYTPMKLFYHMTVTPQNSQHIVKPGESYQVTLASGGGACNTLYKTDTAKYGQGGQSVAMYFNGQGGSNNVTVSGGSPATSTIGQPGYSGMAKVNGTLPGYVKQLAYVTKESPSSVYTDSNMDFYSPIDPLAAGMGGVITFPRLFPMTPFVNNEFLAFGAPGFKASEVGVGGGGCAVSYLITNTTNANITLDFRLGAYQPGGGVVNREAGLPAAVIISRIFPTGKEISNNTTSTTYLYPSNGVQDGDFIVTRGFNLADEFIRQFGRAPTAQDNIRLNVSVNVALIGNDASPAGITIDSRCNGVASIIINNSGYIAGLGGNGAGGDYGGKRGLSPTAGNTGIKNTSTVNVVVNNSGLIGGGGGGAGTHGIYGNADTVFGGTGGVPYGYSNRTGAIGIVPLTDAGASTWTYKPTLLGTKGADGNSNFPAWQGKEPGLIKEGLVTINNLTGGTTKGR